MRRKALILGCLCASAAFAQSNLGSISDAQGADMPGAGGQREIWTAPVEGDPENPRLGKAEPFLRGPFSAAVPRFSPDGRRLAYQSNETGTNEVYVRPFPGPGATVQSQLAAVLTPSGRGPEPERGSSSFWLLMVASW
jgi:hypothetical protein